MYIFFIYSIYLYIYICCNFNIHIYTETANFRLFSANRKQKLGFLGWQMTNGNQHLLFQQTCLSMLITVFPSSSMS